MNITIEMVDEVINRTGCTYQEAKDALTETKGDVLEAVILIEDKKKKAKSAADIRIEDLKVKVKKAIREGNVNKIVVKRNDEEVLTIPVNVGIVGGIVGITAAPLAMIAAAVVAYGLDCRFEIHRNDGSSEDL